jgi:hypothetical protein
VVNFQDEFRVEEFKGTGVFVSTFAKEKSGIRVKGGSRYALNERGDHHVQGGGMVVFFHFVQWG